jgi:hypothetical protein
MNWRLVKNCSKWLWIAAVLVFIIFYAIAKKGLILQAVSMLSMNIIFTAGLLIFAAKLCLVVNMRQAAHRFSIALTWAESYRIYNLTQLAKYIPGSVWQFVGRIAILRERGVPAQAIRDSLLAEHFWVIVSAGFMAPVLVLGSNPDFFPRWLTNVDIGFHLSYLLPAMLVFAILIVLVTVLKRNLIAWLFRLNPPFTAIPSLLLTWLFLGTSLWVMLVPFTTSLPSLVYVIGIYCLAYVAGFLVPFAPAGLGIREAILVFGLVPFMASDEAIVLAAMSRVIYFSVEIVAAAVCFRRKELFNI